MKKPSFCLLFFTVITFLFGCSSPDTDLDAGLDAGLDTDLDAFGETITYRTVDGVTLEADVRVPEGEGPFDAVVLIHGGAFVIGDKNTGPVTDWQDFLPNQGLLTFNVNYRLARDFDTTPHFPAPLQDVKCAIQWLRREQSRYRGIEKVYILGGSSGGYYSAMIGVTGDEEILNPSDCPEASNAVDGAISFFGIHDFVDLAASELRDEDGLAKPEADFVGSACRPPEIACRVASPVTYLTSDTPRFFLAHSKDDGTIPVSQSRLFDGKLKENSVEHVYTEIDGMGHGWHGNFSTPVVAEVRDQIVAWLKK